MASGSSSWVTPRAAKGARMSIEDSRGFSRAQRDFADALVAQRDARAVLRHAEQWHTQMGAVNIVTALHRIAKHEDAEEVLDDSMFLSLGASIPSLARSGAVDPRGLANTAWAFASIAFLDGPLMDAIAAAAIRKISEFYGQSISNMAWSIARLCLLDSPLIASLSA
mmetsp:Transcript_89783/g.172092  ORF Transcript_89783/g.172092 Transcript_89783/m.172092 type:complete len:167 (-) Transcript_89783:46-546(-)